MNTDATAVAQAKAYVGSADGRVLADTIVRDTLAYIEGTAAEHGYVLTPIERTMVRSAAGHATQLAVEAIAAMVDKAEQERSA